MVTVHSFGMRFLAGNRNGFWQSLLGIYEWMIAHKQEVQMSNYQIETKCIQSGWHPKKGEPRVLPIYQSTTYKYDTSDQMGRLFDLEESGYFYTRLDRKSVV